MYVLHYLQEIKPMEELTEFKKLVVVREDELKLVEVLIQKLTAKEFDLGKFKDAYTEALMEIIKAKIEGKEVEAKERVEVEEARSLMDALKASIEVAEKKKKES